LLALPSDPEEGGACDGRVRGGSDRVGMAGARVSVKCFLAEHGVHERGPMPPCDGGLVRAHLIPKRELRSQWRLVHHRARGAGPVELDLSPWPKLTDLYWDPRAWVPACGGPTGIGGHHGMLDHSRTLRLPREAVPEGTEELARLIGLTWWLDREYGEQEAA
jgi:hypothetical protein